MDTNTTTFSNLGIAPRIFEILERLGFTKPTPIQAQAIPLAREGKDVVGVAQTGTGKTLAFGIPMLERIVLGNGKGLVVLPTRELALQVEEELRKIGGPLGLKTVVLIGGTSSRPQLDALRRGPHIVIATPGRLNDHLEQKNIMLDKVTMLVLDEADRMLDMGFLPQIKKILKALPKERQTLLFSATLPPEIMTIAKEFMALPVRIEIAPQGTTADNISQEIMLVRRDLKLSLLQKVLIENTGVTLVFTRTKHGARKVAHAIREMGHTASEIHSNRSLGQRKDALLGFKNGKYRVLVATDIAARGIDVRGIALVVNYDLPENSEDYVHRIGRTGRGGDSGHAISFATPDEKWNIKHIERLIKKNISISEPKSIPLAKLSAAPEERPERSRSSRPRTEYRRSSAPSGTRSTSSRGSYSPPRGSGSYAPRASGYAGSSPRPATPFRKYDSARPSTPFVKKSFGSSASSSGPRPFRKPFQKRADGERTGMPPRRFSGERPKIAKRNAGSPWRTRKS